VKASSHKAPVVHPVGQRTPTESLLEAADISAISMISTSKQYTKNTQTIHKKQIHKLRNILFNSQTKKYTKIGILILMGRLML
jgi:hypothetical protein